MQNHVMNTYGRMPVNFISGAGSYLTDSEGKTYFDGLTGIAVCGLGHAHPHVAEALAHQAQTLLHTSNLYEIPLQTKLANRLCERSGMDNAFFCNSGAEANEAAIKLARKHGHQRRGIEQPVILTAAASFHGRTLAAVSATGQPKYHKGFEPMVTGFDYFPYNDLTALEALINRYEKAGPSIAAVLVEPLQGEGGVNPGDRVFFSRLRDICTENNILLILDEVQVGMGRSGRLWGYEQLGISPDAFTLAKGLGGGHAIGALLVNASADLFEPGDHASTFGGNPFACRAGLTVATEIERRDLLTNVTARGEQLRDGLQELVNCFPEHLQGVRGWGLLQGIMIREGSRWTAPALAKSAVDHGLLLVSAGPSVLRMVPPLTINKREVRELLRRLAATLSSLS